MLRSIFYTFIASSIAVSVSADDTEIYLNPSAPNAAPPLVMLTLDWRPNLGSSSCGDYTSAACEASVGSVIYPHLVANIEEFGIAYRDTNNDGIIDELGVEPFDLVRAALRALLSNREIYGVHVGLMISHENNNNCNSPDSYPKPNQNGCSNGAYILKGFTPLEQSDFLGTGAIDPASPRYALLEKLGKIPAPQGNVAHPYQLREMYYEFANYLTGGMIYNGHLGYNDYSSGDSDENLDEATNTYKTSPSSPLFTDTRDFAWDASIESGDYYVSPYTSGLDWSCSKTFMINTFFEDNQQANSDSDFANSYGITLSGGDSAKNEVVISYFNTTDIANGQTYNNYDGTTYTAPNVDGSQTVQSYFITAKTNTNNADDYAFQGGTGRALKLEDPTGLLEDLENIFSDILSVSTTFVAASVPVNVFNRTEVVDNVYFALFQAESTPRWDGNLKKLKILERTGTNNTTYLDIVSAEGTGTNSAIASDGVFVTRP